jgi:hypothetical protein
MHAMCDGPAFVSVTRAQVGKWSRSMLETMLLAVMLAQVNSGGGLFPPTSSDSGFGGMGTAFGSVTTAGDNGRDRSPLSGTGGSTASGGSTTGSDWSGSTGGTSGTATTAAEGMASGGTGTMADTPTAGGTNSSGTMR